MNRGEEGDYAEAIRLANEVIASDEFGLEDKYEDIFTNGYSSKELMFTRHIKTPPSMDDNVGEPVQNVRWCNLIKPTEMYFEILSQDDKRYEATFDSMMLGNGTAARKHRCGRSITSHPAIVRCIICVWPRCTWSKQRRWLARMLP